MRRLVAILALCATAMFAQTNRGSLSCTVSDQTQAVMPGVTPAGAAIPNNIVSMVNAQKTPGGGLPPDFYHIPLGQNFRGKAATYYDITTLTGYKFFQLRNAHATNFGTLYNNSSPRYIQFGVKLYF